jgi:dihydropteroate synthase
MKGVPENMQQAPEYADVLREIKDFLYKRAAECENSGIEASRIIIDPGIGFGKTLNHNMTIISQADFFKGRYPVMLGISRKSFIEHLMDLPVEERLTPSLAAACFSVVRGAGYIRAHDVRETKQMVYMTEQLMLSRGAA